MVSVNTNAAAITALRTLQQTNATLDKTQNRISTGYKIGEAKDNAAYWAISTTLKSDNKSLGTVKDALGLGSATVDVMYQGLNKAKDVLDELKAKLTAATQDGVSRDTIQDEIKQFQDQLKSIATSSVFSGENWLSVDSSSDTYSDYKTVVSSFTRDQSGAISIGTIGLSTKSLALFDSNTAAGSRGILDAAGELAVGGTALTYGGNSIGNHSLGGLKVTSATAGAVTVTADNAVAATSSANVDYVKFDRADSKLELSIKRDGGAAEKVTIDRELINKAYGVTDTTTDAVIDSAADYKLVLQYAFDQAKLGITVDVDTGALTYKSTTKGTNAQLEVAVTTPITVGSGGTTLANFTGVGIKTDTTLTNDRAYEKAKATMDVSTPVTLDSDDTISFKLTPDNTAGSALVVTLNKKTVDDALHTTDGKINSADDMKKVITLALTAWQAGGYDGSGTDKTGDFGVIDTLNGALTIASKDITKASAITISDVTASAGTTGAGDKISVADIDISSDTLTARGVTADKVKTAINAYINVVNAAINKVTDAASSLGSVASRIDMQKSFVDTLMDTIDKGVGNLIDADMSEESTKLQALQVKQQLGVQALSIANQSAQNILSLFK